MLPVHCFFLSHLVYFEQFVSISMLIKDHPTIDCLTMRTYQVMYLNIRRNVHG